MNNMNNIIKPILKRQLLIMGFGIALYFLVAHFFGSLIGFMANTLFLVGAIFYTRRRDSSIHRSNLSIIDELLILVDINLIKRQDSDMSVYCAVQRLKMHNVANAVLKSESHYFRSYKV